MAFKLFDTNEEKVSKFDKNEVLSILQKNECHSPEQSDSEDEYRTRQQGEKNFLHVYNHSWRSEKVNTIL